ncbi:MAG: dipeptidase [Candidatus Parabeggiatoa sp. nov. 3]|nr:MAG: dipeptidase [Gammaproteobacteria bacterium]RKZ59615.1 MAG: dipeptidase [Gammaproteobacteria bacterium]RKZ79685.1 MAG: dipeptidase [Gammaproteobacteria bacterium]HEW98729.1 M20/M25/M40 family metallo-hydrolase [Beggiatoa sp.]
MTYLQRLRRSPYGIALLNTLLIVLTCGIAAHAGPPNKAGEGKTDPCNIVLPPTPLDLRHQSISESWDNLFQGETSALVKIPTYRNGDLSEEQVIANLETVQGCLQTWTEKFNSTQKTLKLYDFNWTKTVNDIPYWLFGFRLGEGAQKVALITHLDTVPASQSDWWRPFDPRVEERQYLGEDMDFLVGRGALDDKGPAVSTFIVLRAIAKQFDRHPELLNDYTLELIFDTSEETDMATPHYLDDTETQAPNFGVVFDAMWCVRAEKGLEQPVFSLPYTTLANGDLWIESLNTSTAPVNQIPDTATAIIKASSKDLATQFAEGIKSFYRSYRFDDPYYRAADLTVSEVDDENRVLLTTKVAGAQHGSAPDFNRRNGANPLVSLANFLTHLVHENKLASNQISRMTQFMTWGWGTKAFGEKHPELLKAQDNVFEIGTTYALTQFVTDTEKQEITLGIDIRYAIGHHSHGWDGETEGLFDGDSRFQYVFEQLMARFSKAHPGDQIQLQTKMVVSPDVRNPDTNQAFQLLNEAFRAVEGRDCPRLAIGGGTDAKGHSQLLAAGPLFDEDMGPPVNYHGQNEGAPMPHIKKSSEILYHLLYTIVSENIDLPSSDEPSDHPVQKNESKLTPRANRLF